ncbi:hypothetical protein C805_02325 [Eubacterium sp. 14-2]|nr:hypothetical protein C805_02325 [Eubacterium sp. 14-2]
MVRIYWYSPLTVRQSLAKSGKLMPPFRNQGLLTSIYFLDGNYMARMVKCCVTGIHGESDEFYKIGRDWFKDKDAYINYLKFKDVTYKDILSLLTENKNKIISSSAKDKIIEVIMLDHKAE